MILRLLYFKNEKIIKLKIQKFEKQFLNFFLFINILLRKIKINLK